MPDFRTCFFQSKDPPVDFGCATILAMAEIRAARTKNAYLLPAQRLSRHVVNVVANVELEHFHQLTEQRSHFGSNELGQCAMGQEIRGVDEGVEEAPKTE